VNKNTVIGLLAGVFVGAIVGFSIGKGMYEHQHSAPMVAAPAGGGGVPGAAAPMPAPGGMDAAQRIAALESVVARDPKNAGAWTQLGNDYFDTNQPQKAIDAYQRSLELSPNNPDVLTDQGVMYRAVNQFDRAAANFRKANELNPRHLQSLFNLGIVYAYDLKQPQKAVEAWNKIVATDPNSQQAIQARAQLEQLKSSGAR
jgi:cytochrome c-type biogenesis protein CcmH/NrfG